MKYFEAKINDTENYITDIYFINTDNYYKEETKIAWFNFKYKEGYLIKSDKEIKSIKALINKIYRKYPESMSINMDLFEIAKQNGKQAYKDQLKQWEIINEQRKQEREQKEKGYIVGNRGFINRLEAEKYCLQCDFDFDMITV